jgi:hypothetical protein
MKRLIMIAAIAAFLALPAVAAADLDLKVTDHGTTCSTVTNSGTAVECIGKWSGLSNEVTLVVSSNYSCQNGGGNLPPGQTATGQQTLSSPNGSYSFDITTNFVCPHDTMTATSFTSATISAYSGGVLIFMKTYSVQ